MKIRKAVISIDLAYWLGLFLGAYVALHFFGWMGVWGWVAICHVIPTNGRQA